MLGGEGEHAQTVFGEQGGPGIRIEPTWVPGLVHLVVAGSFWITQLKKWPGFFRKPGDGIQSPVDADAVFHVLEGFVGGVGSPSILWNRFVLDVRAHPFVV